MPFYSYKVAINFNKMFFMLILENKIIMEKDSEFI